MIPVEAFGTGGYLDEFWTESPGLFKPHGCLDVERLTFLRTSDDTGAGFATGDADGFTAVFGIVQMFDRCKNAFMSTNAMNRDQCLLLSGIGRLLLVESMRDGQVTAATCRIGYILLMLDYVQQNRMFVL